MARSGMRMASRMLPSPLISRYSGRDRPAWRMNHTGTVGPGSPRQARRKGASCGGATDGGYRWQRARARPEPGPTVARPGPTPVDARRRQPTSGTRAASRGGLPTPPARRGRSRRRLASLPAHWAQARRDVQGKGPAPRARGRTGLHRLRLRVPRGGTRARPARSRPWSRSGGVAPSRPASSARSSTTPSRAAWSSSTWATPPCASVASTPTPTPRRPTGGARRARPSTSAGSRWPTPTRRSWSSTGGRRWPSPSTGPPAAPRWAWPAGATSPPGAASCSTSRTSCSASAPSAWVARTASAATAR